MKDTRARRLYLRPRIARDCAARRRPRCTCCGAGRLGAEYRHAPNEQNGAVRYTCCGIGIFFEGDFQQLILCDGPELCGRHLDRPVRVDAPE